MLRKWPPDLGATRVVAQQADSNNCAVCVVTNPKNPKVRKSGAVAKAVLASMVLEEGSIRAARGDSRDIRRIKETSAARDAGFAVYSSFLPCTIKLPSCIFTA